MQESLIKKGIVLTIIVLFIGMGITPSTATELKKSSKLSFDGNTLYVGGNGPGNYSKINNAYNAANPGDTIFVYSGIYYEKLWIEKTINLIGEDPDTTSIIYNSKTTAPFRMEAPYIVISGFTIYNPNPNLVRYISLRNEGHHAFISNCIFYNSPLHFDDGTCGISIVNSSYNKLSNCTFLYNDDEGICLNVGSSHNIVENCFFSNCGLGIELQNSSYNIIDRCIMKDGSKGIGITMKEPYTSNYNIIKNCEIYNNDGGIYLNNGCNNVIFNCSLENNEWFGIYVCGNYSYNNIITKNLISNNTLTFDNGILLAESCHDNTFSNNNIINCKTGVCIESNNNQYNCDDNLFYHNNFIDNTISAYDECKNFWDKGYPTGGNYWSDYTGEDNDGDGIGDTPYDISGPENNKDYYPLMELWVKDEVTVEASGPYYGLINIPLQFNGLAVGGYKPYNWYWDFGDTNTADEQNPTHTYTEAGKYDVTLTVTDSHSNSSDDTTFAWIQETNNPPNTPSITGEANGKVGIEYDYKFETIDIEENPVWYTIEWGDGTSTGWLGPYNSGQQITLSHSWYREDTFTIKVKAKDVYGDESDWGTLTVTMPRNKYLHNSLFLILCEQFPNAFPILRYIFNNFCRASNL